MKRLNLLAGILLAAGSALVNLGCGGEKANGADAAGVDLAVRITPGPAQVTVGQTLAFTAQLPLGQGFTWAVVPASLGTFRSDGVFLAQSAGTGVVVATWQTDTRYVGTASLQTFPAPDATITTASVVSAGSTDLVASVPDQPGCTYAWSLSGGTLTGGETTHRITYAVQASGPVHVGCKVTNALGTPTESSQVVQVEDLPAIIRFTGLPSLVRAGSSAILQAEFRGVRGVVDPGQQVIASGGTLVVAPSQSTQYTLTVLNDAGSQVQASASILVGDPCPPSDPKAGDLWVDPATGLTLAWCPPGSFSMGATPGDPDATDVERPAHTVTFAEGFWLSTTKVSQALWQSLMGGLPAFFQDRDACLHFGAFPLRPVEQVSWEDSQDFLARLNQNLGWRLYRLPSEAEWEYACRAGSATRFLWGDGEDPVLAGAFAWFAPNAGFRTWPGQALRANAWNLSDMAGDLLEWTADQYQPDYAGAPADGHAVLGLTTAFRVQRGSSWNDALPWLRISARYAQRASAGSRTAGFRVARPPCTAPVITAFQGQAADGQVKLSWRVEGAARVWIDQGIGDVTGRATVTAPLAGATRFVLMAENAQGWVMASLNAGGAQ